MSKRRITVDNDHLYIVVRKRLFGYARNVQLVSNYGLGIEEIVLSSENYRDHYAAKERARELQQQLGLRKENLIFEK